MQPRRHLALARRGKARVKLGCDDEPEHAVAKELEPLIIGAPGAAVRQRKVVKRDIVRGTADNVGERPGVERMRVRTQLQRHRGVQMANSSG